MSGTSVDGIDFSFLETDGKNFVKIILGKSYKYDNNYKIKIKKFIKKIKINNSISLKKIDLIVSKKFLKMTIKFISEFNIKTNNIDYIGLSGQTILHKPDNKISIQLGSGSFLSRNLKINVISNFRENDILNDGQGAPIGAFYHKFLINKLNKKTVIINIGGISNICFAYKKKLIAFDLGPGNSLIDDYMWIILKKNYDKNGNLSSKGKLNKQIIKEFLNDKFFKKKYPKSLDREYFNHFLNKVKNLNKEDAIHTLSMMTVISIIKGINLLNEKIEQIILTGGGRKNNFIYEKLKEMTKIHIINIDKLGINGDLIESEAFGYLAARSIKKLPLSINTTTGVKKQTTGGILYKFN